MPTFIVPSGINTINLKTFLAQQGISARAYKNLKATGMCQVNGQIASSNLSLQENAVVKISFPPETTEVVPMEGPLDILYEDEMLLAVNKSPGLLTHPTVNVPTSLANYVADYYMRTGQAAGIHPVSRLDKETTGVVLFAKYAMLHHMVTQEHITKIYQGLVQGHMPAKSGSITAPIARKPGSIIEREINFTAGRSAHTDYEVLEEYPQASLVQFTLHTGRTHQIRVHCAYLGCPLVGDNLYGTPGPPSRHMLHASQLTFPHPFTGEILRIIAPLPQEEYTQSLATVL